MKKVSSRPFIRGQQAELKALADLPDDAIDSGTTRPAVTAGARGVGMGLALKARA
jgi:hypothetical protein